MIEVVGPRQEEPSPAFAWWLFGVDSGPTWPPGSTGRYTAGAPISERSQVRVLDRPLLRNTRNLGYFVRGTAYANRVGPRQWGASGVHQFQGSHSADTA